MEFSGSVLQLCYLQDLTIPVKECTGFAIFHDFAKPHKKRWIASTYTDHF